MKPKTYDQVQAEERAKAIAETGARLNERHVLPPDAYPDADNDNLEIPAFLRRKPREEGK